MKAAYDEQGLKGVLKFIRVECGQAVFRDAGLMYGFICDLAPGFSAEGEILRKLSQSLTRRET